MTKSNSLEIDILIAQEAGQWTESHHDFIEKTLRTIFDGLQQNMTSRPFSLMGNIEVDRDIEVSVLLTDAKGIQGFNAEFRGRDRPTNVLSFPQFDDLQNICFPAQIGLPIGDIVVAYEIVDHEAQEKNISFMNHLAHMLLHGFLHLLGLDHQTNEQADIMENIEIKLLEILQIDNPYEIYKSDA